MTWICSKSLGGWLPLSTIIGSLRASESTRPEADLLAGSVIMQLGEAVTQKGPPHIHCLPLPLPTLVVVGGIGAFPSSTNVNTRASRPGRAITDTYCFPSSM